MVPIWIVSPQGTIERAIERMIIKGRVSRELQYNATHYRKPKKLISFDLEGGGGGTIVAVVQGPIVFIKRWGKIRALEVKET